MASDLTLLAQLANCFDYPRTDTAMGSRLLASEFGTKFPEMRDALQELSEWLESAAPGEPQERYTDLFDLKPVCTLNISFHLWGDTYQRGAFLSEISRELREVKIDPGDELPDYLPTILRLLERINDVEDLELIVEKVLLPALQKMTHALETSSAPWAKVLACLPGVLNKIGWSAKPAPTSLHVVNGGLPMATGGGCPNA